MSDRFVKVGVTAACGLAFIALLLCLLQVLIVVQGWTPATRLPIAIVFAVLSGAVIVGIEMLLWAVWS